jgi:hypothetical protein
MNNKTSKIITGAMALSMAMSAAPMTVSAASVKAPSKVTISSASRTSSSKVKVTWKKLKKSPSGYAVYQKKGSSSWKLVKRVSNKTTSLSVSAKTTEQNQFKVRAYKTYKVTKYYNKKTKKYVSKKSYNKLSKKYRSIKKVTAYKYGSYSSTKTVKQTAAAMPTPDVEDVTEYCNGTSEGTRVSAVINVDGAAKATGVSNFKYVIEKSEDSGQTFKAFATISATEMGDSEGLGVNIYDENIDLTKENIYRIYSQGTFNGKAVKGSEQYVGITDVSMNDLDVYEDVVTKAGKWCADCEENVTNLSDEEIAAKHGTVYYCSVCGDNGPDYVSHNKQDVLDHISEESDHGTATVMSRDAKIEANDEYDEIDSTSRKRNWTQLDANDAKYQKILAKENLSSADKVFVDSNTIDETNQDYIIVNGVA